MQAELGSQATDDSVLVHYAYVARYEYSEVVVQNDNFLRISAYTDQRQKAASYDVETTPPGRKVEYSDRLGNVVHRVRVTVPHEELIIAGIGQAYLCEASPIVADLPLSSLRRDPDAEEFLTATPLVDPLTVAETAKGVVGGADGFLEAVSRIVAWVHENVEYERGNTSVATNASDVLTFMKGVCQDKTHLALGMMRAVGIPAKYVSGLLTRQPGETHAWLEFLHPEAGWLPADPTKGVVIEIGTNYLKFGVGRDYSEAPPVSGSFVSKGSGHLDIATSQVYFDRDAVSFEEARGLMLVDPVR